MAEPDVSLVFECRRCGECCNGQGGIVLSDADRLRLARFLGLSVGEFLERHAERVGGKVRIKTGADGYCVFFRMDQGCTVHSAKPGVCRAWPFFRGNLVDPYSLDMVKDACPGVRRDAAHMDFVRCGLAYLRHWDLLTDDPDGPSALRVADVLDGHGPGRSDSTG